MDPLKNFLLALADDELIVGHRASEWTGLGPILEADLALSSISQDEMGHALLLYGLLHELGEPEPDELVYYRPAAEWRNARLCELPRGDWGDTLVRHFLYDLAEQVRWNALAESSHAGLAAVARKLRTEEKYHLLHGRTWLQRLAQGSEESHARLQQALDQLLPYAVGLWEPFPGEAALVADGVTPPSAVLQAQWWGAVQQALGAVLTLPPLEAVEPVGGGRHGHHSPHLSQLLDAMQLLHREMPGSKW